MVQKTHFVDFIRFILNLSVSFEDFCIIIEILKYDLLSQPIIIPFAEKFGKYINFGF